MNAMSISTPEPRSCRQRRQPQAQQVDGTTHGRFAISSQLSAAFATSFGAW